MEKTAGEQLNDIVISSFITTYKKLNRGKYLAKSQTPVIRKKSSMKRIKKAENIKEIEETLQGKLTATRIGTGTFELTIIPFDHILEFFYDPPIRKSRSTFYDPINETDMTIPDIRRFIDMSIRYHEAFQKDNILWTNEGDTIW